MENGDEAVCSHKAHLGHSRANVACNVWTKKPKKPYFPHRGRVITLSPVNDESYDSTNQRSVIRVIRRITNTKLGFGC